MKTVDLSEAAIHAAFERNALKHARRKSPKSSHPPKTYQHVPSSAATSFNRTASAECFGKSETHRLSRQVIENHGGFRTESGNNQTSNYQSRRERPVSVVDPVNRTANIPHRRERPLSTIVSVDTINRTASRRVERPVNIMVPQASLTVPSEGRFSDAVLQPPSPTTQERRRVQMAYAKPDWSESDESSRHVRRSISFQSFSLRKRSSNEAERLDRAQTSLEPIKESDNKIKHRRSFRSRFLFS